MGKQYCRENPDDVRSCRGLLRLQHRLSELYKDTAEQGRRQALADAERAYKRVSVFYVGAIKEAGIYEVDVHDQT